MSDSARFSPDVHSPPTTATASASRSSSAASPRPRAGRSRPSRPATGCTSASTASCRSTEFRADLPDGVTVSYDQGDGPLPRRRRAAARRSVLADWIRAWAARHGSLDRRPARRDRRPPPRPARPAGRLPRRPVPALRAGQPQAAAAEHEHDPAAPARPRRPRASRSTSGCSRRSASTTRPRASRSARSSPPSCRSGCTTSAATPTGAPPPTPSTSSRRPIAAFIAEHQRRPSEKELAAYMGQSVATLRRNSQTVATLNGLRNLQSLDGGPDATEILLPDSSRGARTRSWARRSRPCSRTP